jgi:hypothetical protein
VTRLLLSLVVVTAAALTPGAAQPQELTNVPEVIEAVNPRAGWYGIVPDGVRFITPPWGRTAGAYTGERDPRWRTHVGQ